MSRNITFTIFSIMMLILSLTFSGCSKKSAVSEGEYDVVIVGAGAGGLSAAAQLSLNGKKVIVIEQHDKVGGYMTAFERDDYRFEVSLHAFDGLDVGGMNYNLFKKLNIWDKVKPIRLDPMYRSYFDDFTLDVPADADAYLKLLKEKFPHESDNLDKFDKTLSDIDVCLLSGLHYMNGEPGKALWAFISNFWKYRIFYKYLDSTLEDVMNDHFTDEKLKAVIMQLTGFLGAGPKKVSGMVFNAMWNNYHRAGYYYFEGGSQSVTDALAEVITKNGGKILLDTRVSKIIMKDGLARGVETKDGQKFTSRYVISNADARQTFYKLVGSEHLPQDYLTKMDKMKPGISVFMVYLGLDKDYSEAFPNGVHEVILNVGYDTVKNFKDALEGNVELMPFALTNYSNVDPTACPKGKTVLSLTAIMSYDYMDQWYKNESYEKYDALKTEVAERLIKRAEKIMPDINDHIEVMVTGSPRTMENFTSNYAGSILGWDSTPEQSMLNRMPQETPIDNLYLAGAWTFPSGGQSAVMFSGLLAADKILKRDK